MHNITRPKKDKVLLKKLVYYAFEFSFKKLPIIV